MPHPENDESRDPRLPLAGGEPTHDLCDAATADAARRRIAKLGIGVPVLMSLASRQALAGPCLSNMLSGNLSNPNRGNCTKGWSPGGWGQPGGMIHTYTTIGAWTRITLAYGTLKTGASGTQWTDYTGGTKVKDSTKIPQALVKDTFPLTDPNPTVRKLLNYYTTTLTRHFLTAYMNAWLSELEPASSTFKYALTRQQVVDLATGALQLPNPNLDMKAFLDSTWQ